MKRRWHILLLGLLLYVLSFFLIAVVGTGPGRGYSYAFYAILLPVRDHDFGRDGIYQGGLFEWFSLLIAGWINIVFLLTLAFTWKAKCASPIWKTAVVLMIPFCWIVFHYEQFYPREGHFVWIAGMLLPLFSGEIAKT